MITYITKPAEAQVIHVSIQDVSTGGTKLSH